MKSDLDILMKKKEIDALLVLGSAMHNPSMVYMTGGGHVSDAVLIKKQGEAAVIHCGDMEREEAARSGLKVIPYSTYPWKKLLEQAGGNNALMSALRLKMMLEDNGVKKGRVGVYGTTDFGSTLAVFDHLRPMLPEIQFIGETHDASVFMIAQETKDETEVEHIRKMGRITTSVVGRVADYLTSCEVREDEVLLNDDGAPVTIGAMKSKINLWLAELGAENPEGTIFAIGRDAGIPHSSGTDTDLLRLGQTIVFDIYPCETGGGYFFDFTRTWSLGYATPEAQKLYNEVKAVYEKVVENLDLNTPFSNYQRLVCEEFEKNGHQTPLNTQAPINGYVHSLGHGLGLNVHERPWSGLTASDDNLLKPGVVMTIEPGLYYPDRGMGVRIEDSYWVRPDGKMEILADYPYDFVLKMKKWKKD